MGTVMTNPEALKVSTLEQGQMLRACMLREMRYTGLLKNIADQLSQVEAVLPAEARREVQGLHREVLQALDSDSMAHFEHIFETMHGGYLQRLAAEYPTLTPTELRLAAFLRLPMPSKEVARLFSCSVRSIEKHRERMRKKFNLDPHDNLTTFLASRV
jgi:DNA-binding CsgD family transcriptional regulator